MDHNGFERQTQDLLAIIKINWINPALCIAWRVMLIFPLSYNLFRGLKKVKLSFWYSSTEIKTEIPAATRIFAFHESNKHFKRLNSQ